MSQFFFLRWLFTPFSFLGNKSWLCGARKSYKVLWRFVKVRFSILRSDEREKGRSHIIITSHHNELKISPRDEFFSKKSGKKERKKVEAEEKIFSTLTPKGDQILKILLWNILLFNKRVVQPTSSSMVYVKLRTKKVKLCGLWFFCTPSRHFHPQFSFQFIVKNLQIT